MGGEAENIMASFAFSEAGDVKTYDVRAEFCEYGPLKDEMIRDRLVVGLKNQKLSELKMNASLTQENAIQQASQSESVKKEQELEVIRFGLPPTTSGVDQLEVKEEKKPNSWRPLHEDDQTTKLL
ncbi:hypothetical protein ACROYT_G019078 [Oculina patagonica]